VTIPQLLAAANMAAGLTLIGLGVALPSAELIGEWRQQMESVVDMTANQVRLVRESLDNVNSAKIAEATQATANITAHAAELLQRTSIDFAMVDTTAEALSGITRSLESVDSILDAAALHGVSDALEKAAAVIEERVAPTAKTTAETLSTLSSRAEQNAKAISTALKGTQIDAGAVVSVAKAIGQFSKAIDGADDAAQTIQKQMPAIS